MSEMIVRHAVAADLPALGAIERDAGELYRSVGYDFCADGPVTGDDELRETLAQGAVLVAEHTGRLGGFALIQRLDSRAYLAELSVARACQKRGIGRRLIARAECWARAQGLAEMTLTTFRDVPWNAPFYARSDYQAFAPDATHPGLRAIQARQAAAGIAKRPRVAMRKRLREDRG